MEEKKEKVKKVVEEEEVHERPNPFYFEMKKKEGK